MTAAELTMSYEALVEAGREARHQADNVQWIEGDLALQVEHLPSAERPRDPETGTFLEDDTKALQRYAADIDVAYATIKTRRRVAEAWPQEKRALAVAWDVHRALAAQDDRFDLIHQGLSVRQAEDVVRKRNVANRGVPGWFELLGKVGDSLITVDKHLQRAEETIGDPSEDLRAKAGEYADWADAISVRLRKLGVE